MENEVWTVRSCLEWTQGYLTRHGDEHARLSAEWLLSFATGLERIELYMSYSKPMTPEELARMRTAVKRRATGEPLQYIVGETTFRWIDVECAPGVLIPRPETEFLVEGVINHLKHSVLGIADKRRERVELPWNDEVDRLRREEAASRDDADGDDADGAAPGDDGAAASVEGEADAVMAEGDPVEDAGAGDAAVAPVGEEDADEAAITDASADGPRTRARVLEVGCGTGCISLSIATELAGMVECVATDIDRAAVTLAERNRARLGVPPEVVSFREGDLVSPVAAAEQGTFDVLVSNPPYIPSAVMGTLPAEVVNFEPATALDGGPDGLGVFRRLVAAAPTMLKPGGLLACELHEDCVEQAAALCRASGMSGVRAVPDLAGRPRYIFARTATMDSHG